MSEIAKVRFADHSKGIAQALDLIGAPEALPDHGVIVVKPNLTTAAPPPVTTDVRAVKAVCAYCMRHSRAEVVIGEGAGTGDTADAFRANGYDRLADGRLGNIRGARILTA